MKQNYTIKIYRNNIQILAHYNENLVSYDIQIGPYDTTLCNLHPPLMNARFFFDFHSKQTGDGIIFGRQPHKNDTFVMWRRPFRLFFYKS